VTTSWRVISNRERPSTSYQQRANVTKALTTKQTFKSAFKKPIAMKKKNGKKKQQLEVACYWAFKRFFKILLAE